MQCVIVVDDSVDASRLLARLLQHLGYRSVCMTSGAAALEYLRAQHADLVILDVMMPDMDGVEVLRRIRMELRLADLPVVMYSAMEDPRVKHQTRQLGAEDYWVKGSLDINTIATRLEAALSAG